MSEPFIKETKKSSLLIKLVLGAVVVAAIAALGVITFKFMSYKETGGIPTEPSNAQVAISYPGQGLQLELSDSVMVEATAIGSKPFISMELWINGELLGLQAAPSGGAYPLSAFFSWTPIEEGSYSLIAAAIDADGQKEMSPQVVVFVAHTETGIEVLSADQYISPSVLPAAVGGGYSPPDKPSGNESQGPASNWKGSTGDWVTSLMAAVKPAAPELVVSAGECGAELQIHDMSDNEEGFAVYRQVGISPMWVKIAALSSQSDLDWITYTDEGIYGAVYYYVTAFNSQGESKSNFVLVSIDPADCPSGSEEIAVGTLGMMVQIPNLSAEKVYCYMSTNGISWERWPLLGFLTPDMEEGNQISGPIMTLNLEGEDQPEDEPTHYLNMSLFMECWGWEGGNLQKLGTLATEGLNPQADKSFNLLGDGMLVELKLKTSVMASQADIYPIGQGINWPLMDPDQFKWQGVVTSAVLPRPRLRVTDSAIDCEQHLPPDAQNFLGALLYCFPYPAYDPNKGGVGPQPYLTWEFAIGHDWDGTYLDTECMDGFNEDCVRYPDLLKIAEETGGQVGFTITALIDGKKTVWNVTEPDLTMFVVPPDSCHSNLKSFNEYTVRTWYRPGNEGAGVSASLENNLSEIEKIAFSPAEILYSKESNVKLIPCSTPYDPNWSFDNEAQYLDIKFTSLDFSDIDDDDTVVLPDTPQSLELYGYFRVMAPSMGHLYEEYCFFPEFGGCDNTIFGTTPWVGTSRYLLVDEWESEGAFIVYEYYNIPAGGKVMGPDTIVLGDVPLCQSSTKYSCENEGQATSYDTDNNTLRVFATHLDALELHVKLVDYDEASDDDVVCIGTKMIPSKTFAEWSSIDAHYEIHGETTDSGSCIVHVLVDAVGAPVQIDIP